MRTRRTKIPGCRYVARILVKIPSHFLPRGHFPILYKTGASPMQMDSTWRKSGE